MPKGKSYSFRHPPASSIESKFGSGGKKESVGPAGSGSKKKPNIAKKMNLKGHQKKGKKGY